VRDTPAGAGKEVAAYRPAWLVAFLADCGSVDSLVIIDACWAGTGSAELLLRSIRELEGTTAPGEEPAYACLVSARGYERARDGAFLADLLQLLEQGPVDVEPGAYDVLWSPTSPTVPLGALLDTISRKRRGRGQHPRWWLSGSSRIRFGNPRFDPAAPARLVEDQVRVVRGDEAAGEEHVATPASTALLARVAEDRAGLWFITGSAGAGKSTCLALAAAMSGRSVIRLRADDGIATLAATVSEAPGDVVFVDALDEAPPRDRLGIVDLAYGWARTRFVAVAQRSTPDDDSEAGAERVIDMSDPEWQGDAIERYVVQRLEGANGAR
jgi:hypothetical protein